MRSVLIPLAFLATVAAVPFAFAGRGDAGPEQFPPSPVPSPTPFPTPTPTPTPSPTPSPTPTPIPSPMPTPSASPPSAPEAVTVDKGEIRDSGVSPEHDH
jgi:outer membrane biosynthesis protein TonB